MSGFVTFPYGCELLIRTAGTLDDGYGNAISTEGTINTFCDLQQSGREEPQTQGEISETTWSLYLPTAQGGTALTFDTGDAVRVNGHVYEVVGDPWYADTGSTRVNHIEATVVRTGNA